MRRAAPLPTTPEEAGSVPGETRTGAASSRARGREKRTRCRTWSPGGKRDPARGLLPAQLPEGFRFMCAISQSAGTPHVPTQAPALLVPQDVSVLLRAAAPQLSPLSRWAPGDWQ